MAEKHSGRLTGRQALAAGQTAQILTYHQEEGTEPRQFTLVAFDPNGGSSVQFILGHNQIDMAGPPVLFPLGPGINVIPNQIFGSSVSLTINAATAGTFVVMLVPVNR